jgi:tetratricopeptide (TPR) repeat protein
VSEKDSPVLEFSFRNMWTMLSQEARAILAILTIYEAPPTSQLIQIATEQSFEVLEKALRELADVTLVSPYTNPVDGSTIYIALPITLSFARHQLAEMGDFELCSRRRLQQFTQQMSLQESEIKRFSSEFERYGISSSTERRAVILCKRAESDAFAGRGDSAELLFKQAAELAPQSAYVHAMRASFELTKNHIGIALDAINEACRRCTRKTGALCFTIKAQILDAQRDKRGRVEALKKALEYGPKDVVLRHQYGVALSRAGLTGDAIEEFSTIIEEEKRSKITTSTIVMALGTRALNRWRVGGIDAAKQDIEEAETIILENPRFQHMASRLQDIKEEMGV